MNTENLKLKNGLIMNSSEHFVFLAFVAVFVTFSFER